MKPLLVMLSILVFAILVDVAVWFLTGSACWASIIGAGVGVAIFIPALRWVRAYNQKVWRDRHPS
jgi:hypothetical protein